MSIQKISFLSGKNILAGNLLIPPINNQIGILFLHGAGRSSKERFLEIQKYLTEYNLSSLAFDFEGVGESQGKFEDGSLENRLKDAESAYDEFSKHVKKIIVVGFSMGGHVAVQLTKTRNIYKLALICAAAYAKEAEDKQLNEEFTKILRTENSWKNSQAFPAVKSYNAQALILYGENDTIVPKEIQETYKEALGNKGKFIILPDAPHLLLTPKNAEEEEAKKQAFKEILSFIEA